MGFVRRSGGGGGGDEGGGDEEFGVSIKRCGICRRELLPWEDTCPDDGGSAVAPEEIAPGHDALLARLLADDEPEGGSTDAAHDDGDAGADAADDADDDHPDDADDGTPTWPTRDHDETAG